MKKTIITGIKPTGQIHLGNYIGAIKPALELAKIPEYQAAYFVADFHGLTKIHNAEEFKELSYGIAATWLALGLDPEKVIFYRQSDVPEKLQKLINKIKTDSLPPEAPKDPNTSIVFTLYKEVAETSEVEKMREQYLNGISWGEAKKELFNVMNRFLEEPREKYKKLMESPKVIDEILWSGAKRARAVSKPFLKEVKGKIGFTV